MLEFFKNILTQFDLRNRSADFYRSLSNAIYSGADFIVVPLLWLIFTPLFVSRLGVDHFGIWMLVNAFLGLGGMFGFGLTDATIKFVSRYRARQDSEGVIKVVRTTLGMYLLLGCLVTAGAYVLAPVFVEYIFKIQMQDVDLAIAALQIGGAGIAIRFVDSVFQSVFQGYERYDVAARFSMVVNAATMIVNVTLVLRDAGLLELLWTTVIVCAMGAIAKGIAVRKYLLPSLNLFPVFDRKTLREVMGFGVFSWLQGMGSILLAQVDRFLIASLLSTSALTYYVIPLQLAQFIHAFLARTASFVFPLTSVVREQKDTARLRSIYFKGLSVITVLAVAIGLPIFLFSENILRIWMGAEFAGQAVDILRVLTFAFAILATSIIPFYFMNGTGYVRLNTLFGLVSGVIVAIVGVSLIPMLGIVGAAWARIANMPTGIISRTIVHYRVLDDRRWYAGFGVLMPVLLPFAIATIFLNVYGETPAALGSLILLSAVCSMAGALLAAAVSHIIDMSRQKLLAI